MPIRKFRKYKLSEQQVKYCKDCSWEETDKYKVEKDGLCDDAEIKYENEYIDDVCGNSIETVENPYQTHYVYEKLKFNIPNFSNEESITKFGTTGVWGYYSGGYSQWVAVGNPIETPVRTSGASGALRLFFIGSSCMTIISSGWGDNDIDSALERLIISNSIKEIYSKSFHNLSRLTFVDFLGLKSEWENIKKDSNWLVNCPNFKIIHCIDGDIEL